MRRLLHLSDLHFGRIEAGAVPALMDIIGALAPDVILVSGDLTQRALRRQFECAARFLAGLPRPPVCVPGNHDVPLYNPLARVLAPLAGYRRWIHGTIDRFYEDDAVAIAGLNTAHGWTTMHGRISERQCRWLERAFERARAPVRIVMSHHPLDLPVADGHPVPARARASLPAWVDRLGVDLFLAGHLHRPRTMLGPVQASATRAAVFSQAGTAISDRHSGRGNGFSFVRVAADELHIEHYARRPAQTRYELEAHSTFVRASAGWQSAASGAG